MTWTVESEVESFLDFMSTKERFGPKRPEGDWRQMSLAQQEDYFVYLRISLEYLDADLLISKEAYQVMLLQYFEIFQYLAHTPSRLQTALQQKAHKFYRARNKEMMVVYEKLMAKRPDYLES